MNTQQEKDIFTGYVNKFYGYGNLIKKYSDASSNILKRIEQKKDYFNSLTEDQRIQMINNDPDFQELQKNVNKLYSLYAEYIIFMSDGLKSSTPVNQPVQPKAERVEAEQPKANKVTIDSME